MNQDFLKQKMVVGKEHTVIVNIKNNHPFREGDLAITFCKTLEAVIIPEKKVLHITNGYSKNICAINGRRDPSEMRKILREFGATWISEQTFSPSEFEQHDLFGTESLS